MMWRAWAHHEICKTINWVNTRHHEKTIANLMDLRRACISRSMGIVLRLELSVPIRIGKDFVDPSLSGITSSSREWWTPIGSKKATLNAMVGLKFADI
jgi:hypothetical protein